jgi:hypothetical protein
MRRDSLAAIGDKDHEQNSLEAPTNISDEGLADTYAEIQTFY